jgi:hypothetical protein
MFHRSTEGVENDGDIRKFLRKCAKTLPRTSKAASNSREQARSAKGAETGFKLSEPGPL